MIQSLLRSALDGDAVAPGALESALECVLRGDFEPVPLAGLLVLLATRPVEGPLLAAAARVLRRHRRAVSVQVRPLVDTCGTGGDGAGSFNVSTAAAMVVAAAGCAVAKHGNRAASSKVGSADVLEAAGCALELQPEEAALLLDATGFAFLFAPAFHPALRHAAPVRRALGVRTLFNLLGPLANPALAQCQLLGVYAPSLTLPVAEALRELGSAAALVVHCAGLDEIGLHAATAGHRLREGRIEPFALQPEQLGLVRAPLAAIAGADTAAANAALLRASLGGDGGARSDVVAINAAAALEVCGAARDLAHGLEVARQCMRDGAALRVLDRYAESSTRLAATRASGRQVRA
jgi:anthranilate phosphoribosyltransferase